VINFITTLHFDNTKAFLNIDIALFIGAKTLENLNVKKCFKKTTVDAQ